MRPRTMWACSALPVLAKGPPLMGREAPDQHDPGREELRRQIGQVPAINEPMHYGPSDEKAHAGDDGEAPNRLLMRPLAAIGVTAVEHIGNEPACDIAAKRRRDGSQHSPLHEADQPPVMGHRRSDPGPAEGEELPDRVVQPGRRGFSQLAADAHASALAVRGRKRQAGRAKAFANRGALAGETKRPKRLAKGTNALKITSSCLV